MYKICIPVPSNIGWMMLEVGEWLAATIFVIKVDVSSSSRLIFFKKNDSTQEMNYRYCPQHFCCLFACCTYTVYCKFTFIECNDCNVYLNYMYLHPVRLHVQLQSCAILVQHSQLSSRTSSRYSSKHTCHGPGILR